jgi:aryl-phospho-beta-D-glucosidase BglC (GH1 family)
MLKVSGNKITTSDGTPVVLKGAATGGHLNMENFITGYPGHEHESKAAMKQVMGEEKFNYFFDKFYEYFWTDEDAKFFASLGLNCLRVPFNYRHFCDDDQLHLVNPKGFELLDRVVKSCAKYQIYTILDLHSAPGGQNQDWHCDSGVHKALFFEYSYFRDCTVNLWKAIAEHYKDEPYVAGYNPLNEPADARGTRLVDFYIEVEKAIRSVDSNHIIFLDGNTYAEDFSAFPPQPFANTVYAIHDYSYFGFPGNEIYHGTELQKKRGREQYARKVQYMKQKGVPIWNGEFGVVYSSEIRGDVDVDATNQIRYKVLDDQLSFYKTADPSGDGSPISWSIWLYKDIGYQGLTYVAEDSKWIQVLRPWLAKKKKLGLDQWGRDADAEVNKIYQQLMDHFKSVIPEELHRVVYPWPIESYVNRVTRESILSQFLAYEFASYFKDLSFEELDEMAACFKFENVRTRDKLNEYLSNY